MSLDAEYACSVSSAAFPRKKLALKCGLDRTYISSVDRGLRNISLYNIWRLAETFKVNPVVFFIPESEFKAFVSGLREQNQS